ncbi:MAG: hypothetical protein M0D57_21070 [Sphingobacteriales bacterium JAD_PAG50586_3]|nr:MAG: hypothetical protein M0D57_21070 [Sphingobacteriales bacterium JAD_PAG50586_3]
MPQLISVTDFAAYKELSVNIDDTTRINPYILQAQQFDLKPLVGEVFYKDIIDNPTSTENSLLLTGGAYAYQNKSYEFSGLKSALVYFAYARLLENQNINVTRFGVVFKNNADVSERVDEKTLQRLILQARNQARAYWDECEVFLNRQSTDFPLWSKAPITKPRINISAIG